MVANGAPIIDDSVYENVALAVETLTTVCRGIRARCVVTAANP